METFSLSAIDMLVLIVAISLSSIISSVTGMAGGILMFSAMSLFIPLRPLIAIHGVVQAFNNGSRCWALKKKIHYSMCVPFAVGASIGVLLTTWLVSKYVDKLFPLLILSGLIFYTLFVPKRYSAVKIKDKNFIWVGLATGSVGILAGAIDPLLAAFFLRDDLSKEEVVANKSMMQFIAHILKVPAFMLLGFSFYENIGIISIFIITAIIASYIGVFLLYKISNTLFFTLMWWTLFFAGIHIVYQIVSVVF